MINKYNFDLFIERVSTSKEITLIKCDSPILCDYLFRKVEFLGDVYIIHHLNTLKKLLKNKKSITIFTHLQSVEYFLKISNINYNKYTFDNFFYLGDNDQLYEQHYRLSKINNGRLEDIFFLNRPDLEKTIRDLKISRILN